MAAGVFPSVGWSKVGTSCVEELSWRTIARPALFGRLVRLGGATILAACSHSETDQVACAWPEKWARKGVGWWGGRREGGDGRGWEGVVVVK